jgi:hypothetical protein
MPADAVPYALLYVGDAAASQAWPKFVKKRTWSSQKNSSIHYKPVEKERQPQK